MKACECSECGTSEPSLVWGFTLLARDGWAVAPATNPPGAAERAWLCPTCGARAAVYSRGMSRHSHAPNLTSARARDGKRLRVLLVDDHVLMLRCLVRLLPGCETVVTISPREALQVLESGARFDVIVSDVMMPELNGPELYAQCFAFSPELAQRFVFTSADPHAARAMIEEVVTRVGAAQAPMLLSKPASREALNAAVSSVAAGAAHASGTYFMGFATDAQSAESAPRTEEPQLGPRMLRGSRF